MNNITSKEIIKEYLVNNREHIIDIINPYTIHKDKLLKEMPNEFQKDINEQYLYTCKQVLIKELSEAMLENVSVQDIIIDVNSLNLLYYISSEIIDV
jgi:hypothetical protein